MVSLFGSKERLLESLIFYRTKEDSDRKLAD
jgi:hypothetical protein